LAILNNFFMGVAGIGRKQPNRMLFLIGSIDFTNETFCHVLLILISLKNLCIRILE